MSLARFSDFLNEKTNLEHVSIGVHSLEEALELSQLLQKHEYSYVDNFNDDVIKGYFDTYRFDEDEVGIFVFNINTINKKIMFRGHRRDNFYNLRDKENSFLYPDDMKEIKTTLGITPTYTPRKMIYEKNHNIDDAREIVIIINNIEEYEQLKNMVVNNLSTGYNNRFNRVQSPESDSRFPMAFFFCVNADKVEETPGYVTAYDNQSYHYQINKIINNTFTSGDEEGFNGVYKKTYSIRELDEFKKIILNKKIYHIPTYQPRKMIYESYSDDYENLIIICDNIDFFKSFIFYLFRHNLIDRDKYNGNVLGDMDHRIKLLLSRDNVPYIKYNFNDKELSISWIGHLDNFLEDNKDKYEKIYTESDFDTIKRILVTNISTPNYGNRKLVYESNNSKETAKEISIKIKDIDEFDKLREMVHSDLNYVYGKALDLIIPSGERFPMVIFFCVNENRVDDTPGYVTSLYSSNFPDYVSQFMEGKVPDMDGVYEEVFSINDIDEVKRIVQNKRIDTVPQYRPRRMVYEDNDLKLLNKFNNFLLDNLLESYRDNAPFVISQKLEDILKKIKHPISKKLIELSDSMDGYSKEVTLIDIDNIEDDRFVYTIANKFYDAIKRFDHIKIKDMIKLDPTDSEKSEWDKSKIYDFIKTNPDVYYKFPTAIKIGRLINKLFPGEFAPSGGVNSIENFVDKVISKRNEKYANFEIVEGEDIIKYYNESSYYEEAFNGSELGNSCMKYDSCTDYIQFYAENPDVRLLILRSGRDKDKIVGRALLWKIQYHVGEEQTDKYFLDRIYFTKRYQMNLFKQYALKNGWYYKKDQNSLSNTQIFDPSLNFSHPSTLRTTKTFKKSSTGKYPYLDTLKWFYVDRGFLSNSLIFRKGDEEVYHLSDTEGGYDIEGAGKYVEFYNDWINEEDLVYCEYGDDYRLMDDAVYLEDEDKFATQQYADDNCIFDEGGYCILKNKAVKFVNINGEEKYTSKKYAIDNYYYNSKDNKFHESAEFSEYYGTYIPSSKAVKVYLTNNIDEIINGTENFDWFIKDDNNYIEYNPTNRRNNKSILIQNDYIDDNFIEVVTDLNKDTTRWYHKERDKDKFIEQDGEYVSKEALNKKGK